MKIIQSKLLNQFENLIQGFTTKSNGNIAFHVNDARIKVIQNHRQLATLLSYDIESLVHMQQVHKTDVRILQGDENFYAPPTCDALITNKRNIPLMVMVADCSPLLFYDANKKAIAVVHAGRMGAFENIIQATITSFEKNFNSHTKDIYVSVGPSIRECCYEVGLEVFEEAKNLNLEFATSIKKNSYYLNISKILHQQLLDAGIEEKNMEFSQECTACSTQKYFSYRAEQNTGRFAGVLMLT